MKIDGRFWLTKEGENFLGSGRIELLQQIKRTGSIHAAAKAMKMSYKAAWERITEMNRLADHPIIEKSTGGKGGGGSVLTAHAHELIETFRRFEELHRQFIERFAEAGDDPQRLARILSRTFLTTSARNQLHAKVESIEIHGLRGMIELRLTCNALIRADITLASIHSMGLTVGSDAYAIIKSSDVILSKSAGALTCNVFEGTIASIERCDESAEVVLSIGEGVNIVGATKALEGLAVGMSAYALIETRHVIVGV
ncbi:MAG: TOBE domain-containing protein [Campylobacterales bacterium]|nr:TOBE domain-containing protein [Campylobacterales bacterium]